MAIRICPECGGKCTDTRKDCIHCGYIFPVLKKCPECEENILEELDECPVCGFIFRVKPPIRENERVEIALEEQEKPIDTERSEGLPADSEGLTSDEEELIPLPGTDDDELSVVEEAEEVEESASAETLSIPVIQELTETVAYDECEEENVCPYCGATQYLQMGIGLFMCSVCKGKYLSSDTQGIVSQPAIEPSYQIQTKKEEKGKGIEEEDNSSLAADHEDVPETMVDGYDVVAEEKTTGNRDIDWSEEYDAPAASTQASKSKKERGRKNSSLVKKLSIGFGIADLALIVVTVTLWGVYYTSKTHYLAGVIIPFAAISFVLSVGAFLVSLMQEKKFYPIFAGVIVVATFAILLSNSVITGVTQKADYYEDGYFYQELDFGYTLIDVKKSASGVIPKVVNDKKVVHIGEYAFYDCDWLTEVTIPDSVTSIGENAFVGCPIERATIPAMACTHIKNSALRSVTITSGNIHNGALSGCTELTSVVIGNSVTNIGSYAFSTCTGLTSITIPNSVTNIGSNAFGTCTGLTSITIPNSVTNIGSYAFGTCTGLTEIRFNGTKTRWEAIAKGANWDYGIPEYIVYCTNGSISK